MSTNKTNDFAIISRRFDENMTYCYGDSYNDFYNEFSNFCNNVITVPRVKNIDSSLGKKKVIHPLLPNKSFLVYNCPAYFDVSDFIKIMIPNYKDGMRVALFDAISVLNGTVVINGKKYYV